MQKRMGLNSMFAVGSEIAKFLKLPNSDDYGIQAKKAENVTFQYQPQMTSFNLDMKLTYDIPNFLQPVQLQVVEAPQIHCK